MLFSAVIPPVTAIGLQNNPIEQKRCGFPVNIGMESVYISESSTFIRLLFAWTAHGRCIYE